MAALEPAPGVLRVVVKEVAAGQNIANIFHIMKTGLPAVAWTQGDADNATQSVYESFATQFVPVQTNNLTLVSAEGTDLTSILGVQSTYLLNTVGLGGTDEQALNVALCITWKQAIRYRGGHPRTYLAGLDNSARSDARQWSSGTVTALQTRAETFRAGLIGAGYVPIFLRRIVHGANLTPPVSVPLTGCIVDSRVDSQRRRLG